jgi:hypothetical protein
MVSKSAKRQRASRSPGKKVSKNQRRGLPLRVIQSLKENSVPELAKVDRLKLARLRRM